MSHDWSRISAWNNWESFFFFFNQKESTRKLSSRLKNDTNARRRALSIDSYHAKFVPKPVTHSLLAARSLDYEKKVVFKVVSRTSTPLLLLVLSCSDGKVTLLVHCGLKLQNLTTLLFWNNFGTILRGLINTEVYRRPMILHLLVTNG